MQLRMTAGLKKYVPDVTIINYAAYRADVLERGDKQTFEAVPWGMWDMDHYIALLAGEIARLSDDLNGYGPKGKNYIAHVDIPLEVRHAFEMLKETYGDIVRTANPIYASGQDVIR